MKKRTWLIACTVLIILSCENEDIPFSGCRIASIEDSAFIYSFIYSPNGQLIKIETNSYISYQLTYSGKKLSSITTLINGSPANDGSINFLCNELGIMEANTSSSKTEFSLNQSSGEIEGVLFNFDNYKTQKHIEYLLQNVNSISSSIVNKYYSMNNRTETYKSIQYDKSINPYRLLAKAINNPTFYFNFADYTNLYSPEYLSSNNPTAFEIETKNSTNSWTTKLTFDYKYNESKYPVEILIKNDGVFRKYLKINYSGCN